MNKENNTEQRMNLRLSKGLFNQIDILRSNRPGNVSRNTWIAEAVKEKIERDSQNQPKEQE